MKIALPDLAAMTRLGEAIAAGLHPGDVVALSGGLGTGKSTLARAILKGLGYCDEVPSPTFAIVEVYDPPGVRLRVIHADFYRLEAANEVEELGLDDYRAESALIAEWPENAGGFSDEPGCLSLRLEVAEKGRIAIAQPGPDWLGREPWT